MRFNSKKAALLSEMKKGHLNLLAEIEKLPIDRKLVEQKIKTVEARFHMHVAEVSKQLDAERDRALDMLSVQTPRPESLLT